THPHFVLSPSSWCGRSQTTSSSLLGAISLSMLLCYFTWIQQKKRIRLLLDQTHLPFQAICSPYSPQVDALYRLHADWLLSHRRVGLESGVPLLSNLPRALFLHSHNSHIYRVEYPSP